MSIKSSLHIAVLAVGALLLPGRANCQTTISASDFKMSIECPDTVYVGDTAVIHYTLTYIGTLENQNLELNFAGTQDGFTKLYKQGVTAASKNMTSINNEVKETGSVTWKATFNIEKDGIFSTPAYTVAYKGFGLLDVPVITKEINACAKPVSGSVQGSENLINRLVFEPGTDVVKLGESVLLTLKLQTSLAFLSNLTVSPMSIPENCLIESLPLSMIQPQPVQIDGKNCNEWAVTQFKATPQKDGQIVIPAISVNFNYTTPQSSTPQSLTLTSNAVILTVTP